jgi:hypothetical protein
MFTVQTFLYAGDRTPFTSEFESIIAAIECLIARRLNEGFPGVNKKV